MAEVTVIHSVVIKATGSTATETAVDLVNVCAILNLFSQSAAYQQYGPVLMSCIGTYTQKSKTPIM